MSEEINITFTPEEVLRTSQVVGYVAGDEVSESIMTKLQPYVDKEQLEEGFKQVSLINVESELPVFGGEDGLNLYDNMFGLKINK